MCMKIDKQTDQSYFFGVGDEMPTRKNIAPAVSAPKIHESTISKDSQNIEFARSLGTVVNLHDLTTCPS